MIRLYQCICGAHLLLRHRGHKYYVVRLSDYVVYEIISTMYVVGYIIYVA